MKNNIILERLSSKLYHFTDIENLIDIIDDNWNFRLSKSSNDYDDNIFSNKEYFISFTRQKDYRIGFPAAVFDSIMVRIEFNGDLLNNNFEGRAIDYYNGSKHRYFNKKKIDKVQWENESEDRLFSNKPIIEKINKYINRIDILIFDKEELEYYLDDLITILRNCNKVFIYKNGNDFIRQNNNIINNYIIKNMAKIQINENDIKQMIKEVVKNILNENNNGLKKPLHNNLIINNGNKLRLQIEKFVELLEKNYEIFYNDNNDENDLVTLTHSMAVNFHNCLCEFLYGENSEESNRYQY